MWVHKKGQIYRETERQRKPYQATAKFRPFRTMMLNNKRIEEFVERNGRRPRILVSSMGKKHHDQETKSLATFFAETGFDVDVSPMRQTPQGAARMATENDVHVVCFLSAMNRHKELACELAESLKAEDGENILLVMGGTVPKSDYELLYRAGVALILDTGAADIELVNRLLDVLEKR